MVSIEDHATNVLYAFGKTTGVRMLELRLWLLPLLRLLLRLLLLLWPLLWPLLEL